MIVDGNGVMLSVVVPCYNEAENVGIAYERLTRVLEQLSTSCPSYEIVIIDNNSTDATVQLWRNIQMFDKRIVLLENSVNIGVNLSVWRALHVVRGDLIVPFIPCDMQDPPEVIPEFVRAWEAGYEVVAGVRRSRDEGLFREVRRGFYLLARTVVADKVPNGLSDTQLFTREVLDRILANPAGFRCLRVQSLLASDNVRFVCYGSKRRRGGISKASLAHHFNNTAGLLSNVYEHDVVFWSLLDGAMVIVSICWLVISANSSVSRALSFINSILFYVKLMSIMLFVREGVVVSRGRSMLQGQLQSNGVNRNRSNSGAVGGHDEL